ncbi:hypothetical protein ABK040_015136 [Willaertia magna]
MFDKTVTIIGAGPAGLALARILQVRGVNVEIFEREESIEQRDQGGCLDIHQDKGQVALKACGLYEEFIKISRPEGEEMKILDKHANVLLHDEAKENDFFRPEVDRLDLRKLLLSSLKEGTVHFSKTITSIEVIGGQTGRHKISFKDGSSTETDFLVGCDGAWSKVRSQFCGNCKPNYSGVTFIEAVITKPKDSNLRLTYLVGKGSLFAFSDNKAIMAQLNSNNSIRIYFVLRIPENDPINQLDYNNTSLVRETVLNEFKDWSPQLLDFLNYSEDKFVLRKIYAFPPVWDWKTVPGVTIIGDAAHVMSPFAGEGVNLALIDASDLADCLTSPNNNDWFSAVHNFERKMFMRSKEAAEETETNLNSCIKDGPPNEYVENLKKLMNLNTENH